jgi:hydrogenase maturation protease
MTPPASSFPRAENSARPILLYGYGNPGRQDDGLGVALVEQIEVWAAEKHIPGLAFDSNYQLNVEDALAVAGARAVVFVDATGEGMAPFAFRRLAPQAEIAFSTHAMAPEGVLALAAELYGENPPAWLLAIRGYKWEPNAGLTEAALSNLAAARTFLQNWLQLPRRD